MQTKFYIIIPIYNVGDLLFKCLKSIWNQKYFKHIKVIAINDQSPKWNEERKAIDYFIKKNKLDIVVLVNEKNIGLGPTRNKGVEYIKNNEKTSDKDYVIYVDSDDYLLRKKIKKLYKKINKSNYPDIFRFSFCYEEFGKKFINNKPVIFYNNKKMWNWFPEMTYLAAYKINFIIENNLWFPCSKQPHEDIFFSLATSCLAKSIASSNIFFYCYNSRRDGSITSVYRDKKTNNEAKINWVKSVVFYISEAFNLCWGKADIDIMRFYFIKFEYIFADYRSRGFDKSLITNEQERYLEIYNKLECDYFWDNYKNKIKFNKNIYSNSKNSFFDFWVKVRIKIIIFNLWNRFIFRIKKHSNS